MKTSHRINQRKRVLTLYQKGEISLGKAAGLLGKSVYEIYKLLKRHCVEIGALKEQRIKSREHAKLLFGRKTASRVI